MTRHRTNRGRRARTVGPGDRNAIRPRLFPALLLVAAPALVAGCDDDPAAPGGHDLGGTYAADWDLTVTEPATDLSETWNCPGSLTIESAGGAFSGSFLVTDVDGCELTTGTIEGEVAADGSLSFSLAPDDVPEGEDFFEALTGCDVISADDRFEGVYAAGELTASTSAIVECDFEHFGDLLLDLDLNLRATRD